jgi:hypothetical protein
MGMASVRRVFALREPGLEGPRKSVYACMAFHAPEDTRTYSLKFTTIAGELGVSVKTVERSVKWLKANGYVALPKRHRRANGTLGAYTFTLLLPDRESGGPPDSQSHDHPTESRRNYPLRSPTASSTQRKTAEEEAGKNPSGNGSKPGGVQPACESIAEGSSEYGSNEGVEDVASRESER